MRMLNAFLMLAIIHYYKSIAGMTNQAKRDFGSFHSSNANELIALSPVHVRLKNLFKINIFRRTTDRQRFPLMCLSISYLNKTHLERKLGSHDFVWM